jgi:hypothetical protein
MNNAPSTIGTGIAATTLFTMISTATPACPSRNEIFFVNITEDAGHPEPYGLADFYERDVTPTHPNLDCSFGNSKIFRNFPFGHETVLKGNRLRCQLGSLLIAALKAQCHRSAIGSSQIISCEHVISRTEIARVGAVCLAATSSENQGRNLARPSLAAFSRCARKPQDEPCGKHHLPLRRDCKRQITLNIDVDGQPGRHPAGMGSNKAANKD